MDQPKLEAEIRRFRFHLTESLRESGEFLSWADAKKAPEEVFRALHREYKTAQEILIAAYLEIEQDILSASSQRERNLREHWKAVVELYHAPAPRQGGRSALHALRESPTEREQRDRRSPTSKIEMKSGELRKLG